MVSWEDLAGCSSNLSTYVLVLSVQSCQSTATIQKGFKVSLVWFATSCWYVKNNFLKFWYFYNSSLIDYWLIQSLVARVQCTIICCYLPHVQYCTACTVFPIFFLQLLGLISTHSQTAQPENTQSPSTNNPLRLYCSPPEHGLYISIWQM